MNEILELIRKICDNYEIKMEDNFFVFGGSSRQAGLLISQLQERYNAQLSYSTIFTSNTIRDIINGITYDNMLDLEINLEEYNNIFPLTIQQKQILAHDLIYKSNAFKIIASINVSSQLDEKILLQSISDVLEKYVLFQTTLDIAKDRDNCYISEKCNYSWKKGSDSTTDVQAWLNNQIGIELERTNLAFYYQCTTKEESCLFIGLHHIWGDESTIKLLLDEICYRYKEHIEGDVSLIEPSFQYLKFALFMQKRPLELYKKYWEEKIGNIDNVGVLKRSFHSKGNVEDFGYVEINISDKQMIDISNLAQSCGTSLYSIFLSLYKLLMYQITNKRDVYIGYPIRTGANLGSSLDLGLYVSESLSTISIDDEELIFDFIRRVQTEIFSNIEYSYFPCEYIISMILEEQQHKEILHQIHFNFIEEEYINGIFEDIILKDLLFYKQNQLSDFELIIGKNKNSCRASLVYKKEKFIESYVQDIKIELENLIEKFIMVKQDDSIKQLIRKDVEFANEGFNI